MKAPRQGSFSAAWLTLCVGVGLAAWCAPSSAWGASSATDFNGDGYGDLAIGIPTRNVDGVTDAGAVQILYGDANGLAISGNQQLNGNTPGIGGPGASEGFAFTGGFGSALASADFNGDGYSDLAIGAPNTPAGPQQIRSGAVYVLFGGPNGLKPAHHRLITEASRGIGSSPHEGDGFGAGLAAGNVTGDAHPDLVVGTPFGPGEAKATLQEGAIHVIPGARWGLTPRGDRVLEDGARGQGGLSSLFGTVLAVGDLNGDGHSDLAAGAPNAGSRGAVEIFYQRHQRLSRHRMDILTPKSKGLAGPAIDLEFGWSLATGDFSGDHRGDLAIGAPETYGSGGGQLGAAHVLYGSSGGILTRGNNQFLMERQGGRHRAAWLWEQRSLLRQLPRRWEIRPQSWRGPRDRRSP